MRKGCLKANEALPFLNAKVTSNKTQKFLFPNGNLPNANLANFPWISPANAVNCKELLQRLSFSNWQQRNNRIQQPMSLSDVSISQQKGQRSGNISDFIKSWHPQENSIGTCSNGQLARDSEGEQSEFPKLVGSYLKRHTSIIHQRADVLLFWTQIDLSALSLFCENLVKSISLRKNQGLNPKQPQLEWYWWRMMVNDC